jgi:hypothetical protein
LLCKKDIYFKYLGIDTKVLLRVLLCGRAKNLEKGHGSQQAKLAGAGDRFGAPLDL